MHKFIRSFLVFFVLLLVTANASAELAYCKGKVHKITVRDAAAATEVVLRLDNGDFSAAARIGGSNGYTDHQKAQLSLLTAALLAGLDRVQLELIIDGYNFIDCSNFDTGLPIRFVAIYQ